MIQDHIRYASTPTYTKSTLIFSLGHYISLDDGKDDFSKHLLYFYKWGHYKDDFFKKVVELYNQRFQSDRITFDIITLFPTRTKDELNSNMLELVENVSHSINIPYIQVLRRNRTVKSNHELKTFRERLENITGSIDVTQDVSGKNIIVFDNTATTGISLIVATNALKEKGANNVVGFTLGLSNKERLSDWNDVNYTLKYSKIMNICNSPYLDKEVRDKWKKNQ